MSPGTLNPISHAALIAPAVMKSSPHSKAGGGFAEDSNRSAGAVNPAFKSIRLATGGDLIR